jgi:hypothetical protein
MKRTLIVGVLSTFLFAGILLFNSMNSSAFIGDKKGECCQNVCLTHNANPVTNCDVFLYQNGNLVDRGTTNGLGVVTFCGLSQGLVYTVIPQCDCTISTTVPSFTACTDDCYQIVCE